MKPKSIPVFVICGDCGCCRDDTWAKGTNFKDGKNRCKLCSGLNLKWVRGFYKQTPIHNKKENK